MASGSRAGRGPRTRRGAPAAIAAAAPAPDTAVPGARFADLPAADLVGLLTRSNRRASDFVDVALVLAARERRLADAEAQIRRLAAATEERLQAEIREWRRRAVEAEARLLRVQADEKEEGIGARGIVVASGPSSLKKRMLLAWKSEAGDTIHEDEAAWEEDRDALAIVPHQGQVYDDLPQASFGAGYVGEERTTTEPNHGGDEDMSVEENHGSDYQLVAPENPVPLAVVPPGHELQPNDDGVVEERGMEVAAEQEPEPEVTNIESSEKKSTVTATARPPFMKQGMIYKMVFKALKEKERQQATSAKPAAAASQPSLRCWLYAPPPTEMVAKEEEEGPGDMDEDAPQQ